MAEQQPHAPGIDDFCIMKPISRGAFGKVFLGYRCGNPSQLYAIKVMKKSEMINKNMVSQVIAERDALALTKSPFCVNLFYSLQTTNNVYLIMEYMIGGDVKSLLHVYGFFSEAMSAFYVAEVTLALQYLHKHGIVHRDVKPDNMLISKEGHIKLTDFGLSKITFEKDINTSDIMNSSFPSGTSFPLRTPGQLMSLTSKLAFDSGAEDIDMSWTIQDMKMDSMTKPPRARSITSPVDCLIPELMYSSMDCDLSSATVKHSCTTDDHSHNSMVTVEENTVLHHKHSLDHMSDVSSYYDAQDSMSVDNQPDKNKFLKLRSSSPLNSTTRHHLNKKPSLSHIYESISPVTSRDLCEKSMSPATSRDVCERLMNPRLSHLTTSSPFDDTPSFDKIKSLRTSRSARNMRKIREDTCEPDQEEVSHEQFKKPFCGFIKKRKRSSSPEIENLHTGVTMILDGMNLHQPATKRIRNESSASFMSDASNCSSEMNWVSATDSGFKDSPVTRSNGDCSGSETTTDQSNSSQSTTSESASISSASAESSTASRGTSESGTTQNSRPIPVSHSTHIDNSLLSQSEIITKPASSHSTPIAKPMPVGLSSHVTPIAHTLSSDFTTITSQFSNFTPITSSSFTPISMPPTSNFTPTMLPRSSNFTPSAKPTLNLTPTTKTLSSNFTPRIKAQSSNFTPTTKPSSNFTPTTKRPSKFTPISQQQSSHCTPQTLHERRNGSPCNKIVDSWNMKSIISHNSCVRTPVSGRLPSTPVTTNTPLRTPKSIPRRKPMISDDRILGTPDYLAPELLMRKGHGYGVDWWALGVCLYEFMTGIPPFSGETPEEIFSNILSRDMAWPEGEEELSAEAVLAVELMLTLDPSTRPAAPEIKLMALFRPLFDYDLLNLQPPFVPQPDEPTDTCYFQARNEAQNLKLSTLEL